MAETDAQPTNALVKGSASLGRVLTLILVVLTVVFGIVMIVYGIRMIMARNDHSQQISGKIISANCTTPKNQASGSSEVSCYDVKISYTLPGDNSIYFHTFSGIHSDKEYKTGDPIIIYYGQKDGKPGGIVEKWNSRDLIEEGIAFIVAGNVAIGLMLFLNYLVRRFEYAAAIAGPVELFSILV